MARDKYFTFHFGNLSKTEPFRAKVVVVQKRQVTFQTSGGTCAKAILSAIDLLPNIAEANLA